VTTALELLQSEEQRDTESPNLPGPRLSARQAGTQTGGVSALDDFLTWRKARDRAITQRYHAVMNWPRQLAQQQAELFAPPPVEPSSIKPPPVEPPIAALEQYLAEQPVVLPESTTPLPQPQRPLTHQEKVASYYQGLKEASPIKRRILKTIAVASNLFGVPEFLSRIGLHPGEIFASAAKDEDLMGEFSAFMEARRQFNREQGIGERVWDLPSEIGRTLLEYAILSPIAAGRYLSQARHAPKLVKAVRSAKETAKLFALHEAVQAPRAGETAIERGKSILQSAGFGAAVGAAGPLPTKIRAPSVVAGGTAAAYATSGGDLDSTLDTFVMLTAFEGLGLAREARQWLRGKLAGRAITPSQVKATVQEAENDAVKIRRYMRKHGRLPDWAVRKYNVPISRRPETPPKARPQPAAKPAEKPPQAPQEGPLLVPKPKPRAKPAPKPQPRSGPLVTPPPQPAKEAEAERRLGDLKHLDPDEIRVYRVEVEEAPTLEAARRILEEAERLNARIGEAKAAKASEQPAEQPARPPAKPAETPPAPLKPAQRVPRPVTSPPAEAKAIEPVKPPSTPSAATAGMSEEALIDEGRRAVPGIRFHHAAEAGRLTRRLTQGQITQEQFDQQVARWAAQGLIARKVAAGRPAQLRTPSGSHAVRYAIVEAGDLVPSHDPLSFARDSRYPAGVQERLYHNSGAERMKVIQQANQFDPGFLLADVPTATDGPPIVDSSGVVLSGNGRTMTLKRVYARSAPAARAYLKALREKAESFGLDPRAIDDFQMPVLVRRVEDDLTVEQMRRLASECNQVFTQAMDPIADAISRAKRVSTDTLEHVGERLTRTASTVREMLGSPPAARDIINRLQKDGAVTARELERFIDPRTDLLSEEGKLLIERILLGSVIDDPDLMRTVPRSITQKLERSLAELARIRARPEWDISKDLRDALTAYADWDRTRQTLNDYLSQMDMFGSVPAKTNPKATALLQFLERSKPTEVKKAFARYAQEATRDIPGQETFRFVEKPTPQGAFERAFLRPPDEGVVEQGTLFAEVAKKLRATGGTRGRRYPPVEGEQVARPPRPAEMPPPSELRPLPSNEMVRLARDLLARYPIITKRLRRARGMFKAEPLKPEILIRADQAGESGELLKVLAHEIGHAIDWLPDKTLARGNILGRIASLKRYFRQTIDALPTEPSQALTPRDRAKIRRRVAAQAKADGYTGEDLKAEIKVRYAAAIQEEIEARDLVSANEVRRELADLILWWRPRKSGLLSDYERQGAEMYADALSVFLNAPDELRKRAPLFWRSFLAYMNRKPEVRKAYVELFDLLNRPQEEIIAERRKELYKGFKRGEEILTAAAKQPPKRLPLTRELEKWLLGQEAPLEYVERKAAKARRPVPFEKKASTRFDEYLLRHNKEVLLLDRFKHEIDEPLHEAGLTREQAGEYLAASRMVTERKQLANPYGFTPETAQEQLDDLRRILGPEKFSKLEQLGQRFRQIVYELAEEGVRSGSINAEVFETKIKPNKGNYATFAVLDWLEKDPHIAATVKPMIGTFKPIGNPYTASLVKTLALSRLNEIQQVKRSIIEMIQQVEPHEITHHPWRKYGRTPRPRRGKGLIPILENGRLAHYEVDAYIAEVLDREGLDRFAAVFNRVMYGVFHPVFVKYNPGWAIYNPLRDYLRTLVNLPLKSPLQLPGQAARLAVETAKAGKVAWKLASGQFDQYARQLLSLRALGPTRIRDIGTGEEDYIKVVLANAGILKTGEPRRRTLARIGMAALDFVEKVNTASEYLGKIAGYETALRTGMPPREAAHFARNYAGTPNIYRGGRYKRHLNALMIYLNVALQGYRADLKMATQPKTAFGWWFKVSTVDLLPKFLMHLAAAGAFGVAVKEIMDKVSDYYKSTYIVIPVGMRTNPRTGKDEAVTINLPHTDTGRVSAKVLWKLLNESSLAGKISGAIGAAYSEAPNLSPLLDIGTKWVQMAAGFNPVDPWAGRNVISRDAWLVRNDNPWPAMREMLRYTARQFGVLSQIGRIAVDSRRPAFKDMDFYEWLSTLPGPSRFLKINNYGDMERTWKQIEAEDAENAAIRLYLPESARQLSVERYRLNRLGVEKLSAHERARRATLNAWHRSVYLPYRKAIARLHRAGASREKIAEVATRMEKFNRKFIEGAPSK